MNNKNTHSLRKSFTFNDKGKDKKFKAQKRIVYKAFSEQPKTMLQVSVETGIMRANICRYVGNWKRRDAIKVAYLGICPISKTGRVQFLTTDLKE